MGRLTAYQDLPDPRGHEFVVNPATYAVWCPRCRASLDEFLDSDRPTCDEVIYRTNKVAPTAEPEEFTEAEQLGLLVGAAYGAALHERDEARAEVVRLGQALERALDIMANAVKAWPETTWAQDSAALERLVQGIESLTPVDSPTTPTQQEDQT